MIFTCGRLSSTPWPQALLVSVRISHLIIGTAAAAAELLFSVFVNPVFGVNVNHHHRHHHKTGLT